MANITILLGVTLYLLIGLHLLKADIEQGLCHSQNVQMLSIFNLGEHIIFQDINKNFWKMNETEIAINSSLLIEKTVKIDYNMANTLGKYFDIHQNIFAFNAVDEEYNSCSNGTSGEYEECTGVTTDPNIHYTCFVGYKNVSEPQRIEAFKYNYSELQEIQSTSLNKRVQDYCKNSIVIATSGKGDHLIGGLQYFEMDSRYNGQLRRQLLINPKVNQTAVDLYAFYEDIEEKAAQNITKLVQKYEHNVSADDFTYVFRYNQDLGVFGCPVMCTIKSKLKRVNVLEIKTKPNYIETNVTIADLIRCPEYNVWHPNEFCTQTSFQSIFNLGLDVIFQNNGKLWRYMSKGANNYGNPYLPNKLQSIRFDSYMLSFLDQYFDISRPIYGFTFRHSDQDLCSEGDSKCFDYFNSEFKDLPYFRACIFGEQLDIDNEKVGHIQKVEAFYYTPSGLQLFRSKGYASDTKNFCSKITTSLGEGYHLTGILGDHYDNPDRNTDVFAFFKHDSGKVNYYKSIILRTAKLENVDMNWQLISSSEDSQNETVQSINYLWFHNVLVGLSPQKLSDKPISYSMSDLIFTFDRITSTFHPQWGTIYSLYNCPFSQSYSIAYLEEDIPCTDFDKVYSVFQVAKNVYHQKGRHFYRAILTKAKKRLIFDKYFTDIMNDNFDTRFKVTAVSYPLDNYEYQVLVTGRTKYNTRSLGDKIFRAFRTGHSQLAPLEAINSPSELELGHDITFGLEDQTLKYGLIKAMAYWNNRYKTNLRQILNSEHHNNQSNWLLMIYLNHTHLYYTMDVRRFEFPFENMFKNIPSQNWIALNDYQKTSPFTDIFGLFVLGNNIYAAAWPPSNETRDKPRIYKIWSFRESVQRSFFLSQHEKHEYWDFNEYFNCNQSEMAAESSSEEGSNGIAFFIILLLLLLLMGCVVGVIAWDKNNSNTKSDHKSIEVSPNSTKAKSSSTNAPQSGQSTQQNTSKDKPLPQNKEMQKQSSLAPKSGATLKKDTKSDPSIQIRSNISE